MTVLRANFGDILEPGLRMAFFDAFGRKEMRYSDIFKLHTSEKPNEKDSYVTGLGIMPSKLEGVAVQYDTPLQGYDKTYTHSTFAKGYKVTAEMYEDDLYNTVDKWNSALATSAYQRIETDAANILNNAFTAGTGGDGSFLCVTDHTLLGGGTEQNELSTSADLSETSLEQAIIDIEDTVDDNGLLVGLKAKYLVVPTELQFEAARILKSIYRPFSADNEINALVGKGLEIIVWPFLTDADAWFLLCEDHELNFFWRRPLNFYQGNDFDTRDAKFVADMRYSLGWSDWRGVYGSPGA